MIVQLIDWLYWLIGWSIDLLIALIDWLIDWLIDTRETGAGPRGERSKIIPTDHGEVKLKEILNFYQNYKKIYVLG